MIFKPFEPTQSTSTGGGVPTVRVRGDGRLILNAAATRALGDTDFVQLLWEDDSKRFAIRATDEDDATRIRIVRAPSQSTITSKAFVTEHELPYGQRLPLAREGDMLIASVGTAAGDA